MPRTKKVGIAGKHGARYGLRVRKRNIEIGKLRKARKCPKCLKPGLKRLSAGIWECRKCGLKFAGKAYKPS